VEYTPSTKDDPNPVVEGMPVSLRNLTPEERQHMEKKLVRKVDSRLLIMIVIMYILNYLDRNNIAAAKLAGLQKDLNLRGDQYQVKIFHYTMRI
jgi:sugar phosphate permease